MAIVDTIQLPGVPPTDKNGHSAEYDRQLTQTLIQMKAALESLESLINTRRI